MKTYECGEVLVVGGGAAGILACERLREDGRDVTLIECAAIGAEQSNHSHGYLHRGFIYAAPSAALVRELGRGADAWAARLQGRGLGAVASSATVVITDAYSSQAAATAWAKAGLFFDGPTHVEAGDRRRSAYRFSTNEQTFDFAPWFRTVSSHELLGVRTVRGRALRLIREGNEVTGVDARVAGERVRLVADVYVLAAGVGNLELVSTVTRYRGEAINRTSHMFVLRSTGLQPISLVAPDPRLYGLFVVSRGDDGATVWLASDFVSFSGDLSGTHAAAMWVRAVVRNLEAATGSLPRRGFEWAVYPAPKGELRPNRGTLDVHRTQKYGLHNVLVGSPSKLTLAPLLADQLADEVAGIARRRRYADAAASVDADEIASELPVSKERWRGVHLRPPDELLSLLTRAGGVTRGDS